MIVDDGYEQSCNNAAGPGSAFSKVLAVPCNVAAHTDLHPAQCYSLARWRSHPTSTSQAAPAAVVRKSGPWRIGVRSPPGCAFPRVGPAASQATSAPQVAFEGEWAAPQTWVRCCVQGFCGVHCPDFWAAQRCTRRPREAARRGHGRQSHGVGARRDWARITVTEPPSFYNSKPV